MKVQLVSKTEGVGKYENLSSEEIIAAIARHGTIKEDNGRLVKYLMKENHWSPLDMINFSFEIETSRDIGRQILRHFSIKPQEHCITGDTEISFLFPSGGHNKISIKDLYNKWNFGAKPLPKGQVVPMKDRLSKMNIKVYDTDRKEMTTSYIKDVFHNGVASVYEVELGCGRKIKCTNEHKFYHNSEFVPLKTLKVGDIVATNGIPSYQNKEWLELKKEESIKNKKGLQFIADEANCSYHTIRKWLKVHDICYTKLEVASYRTIWNKDLKGYSLPKWSEEAKKRHREITPKGKNHHSYKGGGRSERKYIQDFIGSRRQDIYNLYKGKAECNKCGKINCLIELHHIEPISMNPYKAYDITNIEPLCKDCHLSTHRDLGTYRANFDLDSFNWDKIRPDCVKESVGDNKVFFYKNKNGLNNKRVPKKSVGRSKIKSITYKGEEEVYDLEVEHSSHNYIANKILVHNSQRYSNRVEFEPIELRKEHPTNRQSSTEVFDPTITRWVKAGVHGMPSEMQMELKAKDLIEGHLLSTKTLYEDLLEAGVAKECARAILPGCLTTTMTMNGSLRSWLAFLNVRMHETTQKECREIATEIGTVLEQELPNVFEQIDWRNGLFM